MNDKVMIFAFNGELIYLAHALLNVLDMNERGIDAKLILEGNACKLVAELEQTDAPFADIFEKVKETGLIEGVCRHCAERLGTLRIVERQGIPVLGEMYGHPSIGRYMKEGYRIITL